MAAAVVDPLEAVQIDQQDRHRHRRARPAQGGVERREDAPPVQQARQRVARRLRGQPRHQRGVLERRRRRGQVRQQAQVRRAQLADAPLQVEHAEDPPGAGQRDRRLGADLRLREAVAGVAAAVAHQGRAAVARDPPGDPLAEGQRGDRGGVPHLGAQPQAPVLHQEDAGVAVGEARGQARDQGAQEPVRVALAGEEGGEVVEGAQAGRPPPRPAPGEGAQRAASARPSPGVLSSRALAPHVACPHRYVADSPPRARRSSLIVARNLRLHPGPMVTSPRTLRGMDERGTDDPLVRFGARPRELRRARALSRFARSERAGLDHSCVPDRERGRLNSTPRIIHKLATALGVEPSELFRSPADTPVSQRTCCIAGEVSQAARTCSTCQHRRPHSAPLQVQ